MNFVFFSRRLLQPQLVCLIIPQPVFPAPLQAVSAVVPFTFSKSINTFHFVVTDTCKVFGVGNQHAVVAGISQQVGFFLKAFGQNAIMTPSFDPRETHCKIFVWAWDCARQSDRNRHKSGVHPRDTCRLVGRMLIQAFCTRMTQRMNRVVHSWENEADSLVWEVTILTKTHTGVRQFKKGRFPEKHKSR